MDVGNQQFRCDEMEYEVTRVACSKQTTLVFKGDAILHIDPLPEILLVYSFRFVGSSLHTSREIIYFNENSFSTPVFECEIGLE